MYSSLFSAGLIQLWDAESSPLQGGFPKHCGQHPPSSSGPLRSFLSFDECTLRHQSTAPKHRSDKAAVIQDADNEYRVFMRASSPSPSRSVSFSSSVPGPLIASTESNHRQLHSISAYRSRCSIDSAVTIPTRSGTYRSRSGTRRESSRPLAPRHAVFSTTTSSSSFFGFYPPSSSSYPPQLPTAGLARRRSLPLAKPAPSTLSLPSVPATAASLSQTRGGAGGRRMLSSTTPRRATTTKEGKDNRSSFVPSEFSSGSSTNTVSCGAVLPSSPRKELVNAGNLQESPRGDRREVANTNTSLIETKNLNQIPEHHSYVTAGSSSRALSHWELPQIQTSDFRLSIPLSRSSTASPTSSPRRDAAPSPSSSSALPRHLPQSLTPEVPTSASPISPSSSSIHSLQSIQSMQSMLESTSSTSTVTLDELHEPEGGLDEVFEDDHALLGPGPGTAGPANANGEDDLDLGVEDGLQSFRVSFDLDALGLDAALFDSSLMFAEADADDERSAGLFPMSVHGSSGSEGSEKALPGGPHGTSLRSRSTARSRQTLLGMTSIPFTPVEEEGNLSHPDRGATPNPSPNPGNVEPSPAEQVKMKVFEAAASFPLDAAALQALSEVPSPPGNTPNFDVPYPSIQHRESPTISLLNPSSNISTPAPTQGSGTKPAQQEFPAVPVDRASTVASTRYKETKRSDALAQLEGRVFHSDYQFAPPHLNSTSNGRQSKLKAKTSTEDKEDEIKSISVTSFLPDSAAGSGSSSSNSTLTLSTKAMESRSVVDGHGSGSGYAHSELDLSFGPSRCDKHRTRRIMMLSNAAFVRSADGPASRSSPALLLNTQQPSNRTKGKGASHSASGSFASLNAPAPSPTASSCNGSHKSNSHDGHKRRGPGMPLSTQSTTSSDTSSFACTGMAWSEAGFVSFIDSDSEDAGTGAGSSVSAHPSARNGSSSSPGLFSRKIRGKGTTGAVGTKKEEKMGKRPKLGRKAPESNAANPKRHLTNPTTARNFIDLR